MKRFLLRTLCFLLPLLLLAGAGEVYVRSLPNSYRLKALWMNLHADRVETLILGNSHAYYGIRPQLWPGVTMNLANVSQTAPYDLALLRHYVPRCPRLRQVVLTVDNSYLFDAPLEQSESHRCAYYAIYMGVGPHSRWGRYGYEVLQFDGFREKLKALRDGTYTMCDSLGWGSDYEADCSTFQPDDTLTVGQAIARHTCRDWQWAETNVRCVRQMAQYCRERGIRLTVVQTPVCRAYKQRIPERQQQTIDCLMEMLSREYGAQTLDYSGDDRFAGRDFFDADHLSDIGAARFTQILVDADFHE